MAVWNPRMLIADPGFQLSFLATIGITLLSKPIMRYLSFVPELLGMKESLATTLAAEIATLPVSMLIFRQFSLVAPLSNLLVAPLIPLAMLFGFVGTIVFTTAKIPGLIVGYMTWLILEIILFIVQTLSAVTYASFHW